MTSKSNPTDDEDLCPSRARPFVSPQNSEEDFVHIRQGGGAQCGDGDRHLERKSSLGGTQVSMISDPSCFVVTTLQPPASPNKKTRHSLSDVASPGTADKASSFCLLEEASPTPPAREADFHVIQDWHALLGDKHSSNQGRSTTATRILKQIKQEFKEDNVGKHGTKWYAAAHDEYNRRVATHFPNIPASERGRILAQCTQQVLDSQRVEEPFTYGYAGKEALYGPAKIPQALHFFFKSKDPPTLEKEVERYRAALSLFRNN